MRALLETAPVEWTFIGLLSLGIAILGYAAITRGWAIFKYGRITKPATVKKLSTKMDLPEIMDLFGDDLRQISENEYLWTEDIPNRGTWSVRIKVNDPFLNWTVSFDSTETMHLSYSYGGLKP